MGGFQKSTWMRILLWSMPGNTSPYGSSLEPLISTRMHRMRSLRTSTRMGYILPNPLTRPNSMELLCPLLPPRFGGYGRPLKSNSLLGLRSKRGYGRVTVWQSVAGQIVGFAPFARRCWSRWTIFLLIVITPSGYGG